MFFGERRLTLEEVIPPLSAAGLLRPEDVKEIRQSPAFSRLSKVHPLTWLAEATKGRRQNTPDAERPRAGGQCAAGATPVGGSAAIAC